MKENQFVVDLGELKLDDAQRKKINSAIQRAVSGELSNINLEDEIVLIPVNKWPKEKGPIINGIIIRDFKMNKFEDVLRDGIKIGR